ncbi:MAG: flavodoxin family protein [Mogibacterium sp.]|nr:flavodoxin family protein [Mogibacterium sp.]
MGKKIVAVNAGPRKGWNTDTLISEAVRGAESAGAVVERFDLFDREKYTGCVSCFGCKTEAHKGHCVCQDGLTEVLDAIREADGLIIGSPVYLSQLTAAFRALYERMVFQNLTYNKETPCCYERPVPVLLIVTSNAPDTAYTEMLQQYQRTLGAFVGPTEVLVSGETLQLEHYSSTEWKWTMFSPAARHARHESVFPLECRAACEKGAALAK